MDARKILLVGDAGTLLLLEQMVFHSAGDQIIAAKNGEAGVRAALTHRPGLIVLDLDSPGMPAAEICRRLHVHEATRAVPILLLASGASEAPDETAGGFPFGASGCIMKPIDPSELLSKVRSLLGD